MSKLLYANLFRVKRDRVFWLGFTVMAVLGIFLPLSNFLAVHRILQETGEQVIIPLEGVFYAFDLFVPFAAAIFCSLFIGTEYSDGAIRNKLVIGHARSGIYVANLITCTAVSLVFAAIFMASCGIAGGLTLDGFQLDAKTNVLYLIGSVCLILAFNAMFVCLSMLNQNKAVTAIITLLTILLLLFAAMYVEGRLSEPEFWDAEVYFSSAGQMVQEPAMPNPNYISSPSVRAFLEFLYDFLPGGQAYQFANAAALHPGPMALYSLLIAVVSTLVGIFTFRRKDIK